MIEVTKILDRIQSGDPTAADQLLPLIYNELRNLATQKIARERPGHTLQATALVHEAYIRLMEGSRPRHWASRGHFFSAAGEAMRRILVEQARRRHRLKRGGDRNREEFDELAIVAPEPDDEILALNDALDKLAGVDELAAELVKLRFFAGLTGREAADLIGISARSADRIWAPLPACLVGERVWVFAKYHVNIDPCRLVRQVNKFAELPAAKLLHLPDEPAGVERPVSLTPSL